MPELSLAIMVALAVLVLLLMVVGWRARKRRQGQLQRPESVAAPGATILTAEVFYVATTVAEQPLERIALHGLGFRARGRLELRSSGLLLTRPGEVDVFIPQADLIGAERATWTIDRAVEPGGLLLIVWRLGDRIVDSYLRITDGHEMPELVSAITRLAPEPTERES